jgi:hypothetical protein
MYDGKFCTNPLYRLLLLSTHALVSPSAHVCCMIHAILNGDVK